MNAATFAAMPTMVAYSSAKTFSNAADAIRFAEDATKQTGVTYAVWERYPHLRKLRTFPAATK